ncbi:hypothetical protein BX264_1060 [Streptomyces sp. 2333.5]|uniref:hypothetical protein n=1 Tax=unclassified Streptomyces TaxID=2593676 RepID=UPI00089B0A5C|nr:MULTISPECIES: hypothetical protein [unclassified Streptomyces]PJJ00771.1 hypothetical protein BX264_1060 [Streptomyces sp. 2333.5]SEC18535.1 hypothetical protein SAMN05428943_1196 [Streptomyces sp. 2314.4]SED01757.1 hypothetical protein SAMN05428942_1062 [Streptomyces sp. 2112.2]
MDQTAELSVREEAAFEEELVAALTDRTLHLIILPTEQCNFRCTYCYEDFSVGRMGPETVQGSSGSWTAGWTGLLERWQAAERLDDMRGDLLHDRAGQGIRSDDSGKTCWRSATARSRCASFCVFI